MFGTSRRLPVAPRPVAQNRCLKLRDAIEEGGMNRAFSQALLVLVLIVVAAVWPRPSGQVRLNLSEIRYRYSLVELPAHFTTPAGNTDNTPADNPITDEGATLGRVLFYDTRLLANKT